MRNLVKIIKFDEQELQSVYRLIQNTIDISYSKVYPQEVIRFFKEWHSKEHILDDAIAGYTVVAKLDNEIIGTGTLFGTNIRRVFIHPLHQYTGTGKLIVRDLERRALIEKLTTVDLEASLVSRRFWESLGFVVQREDFIPVKNNKKLYFYRMTKDLLINRLQE
jgi:citrate lyase synthetase